MPYKSEINFRLVSRLIGNLLLFESGTMLFVVIITLIYKENDGKYFIYSSLIALSVALLLILGNSKNQGAGVSCKKCQ